MANVQVTLPVEHADELLAHLGAPPTLPSQILGSVSGQAPMGPLGSVAAPTPAAGNAMQPPRSLLPAAAANSPLGAVLAPGANDQPGAAPKGSTWKRVLGTIGEVAGDVLAPGIMPFIPGTQQHAMLEESNREQRQQAQDQSALTQAQAGALPVDAQARQMQAETDAWKATHPTAQMAHVTLKGSNGEPVDAVFNEHTGQYFDAAGRPISNPVHWTAPTPAHIVQGEDGSFYAIDPHTQVATPVLANGKPLTGRPLRASGLPEILAQVGEAPLPSQFPEGKNDPNYITALRSWGERYEQLKNQEAEAGAIARGAGYNKFRPLAVYDPRTGSYTYQYADQAVASGAAPVGPAQHVLQQQAFFSDIQNASDNLRNVLKNPKLDAFSPAQVAKLKIAMSPEDPGVLSTEMQTFAAKNLTPEQQELVTWLAQLQERALSLRSIAGMGQGSETTRAAILKALPNIASGNTSLALKQLDALDNMVANLERGVGGVKGSPGISRESSQNRAHEQPQRRPVRVNGKVIGYTTDGKTMIPVQ